MVVGQFGRPTRHRDLNLRVAAAGFRQRDAVVALCPDDGTAGHRVDGQLRPRRTVTPLGADAAGVELHIRRRDKRHRRVFVEREHAAVIKQNLDTPACRAEAVAGLKRDVFNVARGLPVAIKFGIPIHDRDKRRQVIVGVPHVGGAHILFVRTVRVIPLLVIPALREHGHGSHPKNKDTGQHNGFGHTRLIKQTIRAGTSPDSKFRAQPESG